MSFKVDELLTLKEVQSLKIATKEELVNQLHILEKEGLLTVKESEVHLTIKDELFVFSLINVPNKMNKEQVLELLDVKAEEIDRIYKQSLYWQIVTQNSEVSSRIEKKLSAVKFDEANLKYDVTQGKAIRKQILKKIQHFNYIKETDNLKANSPSSNPRKESFSKGEKLSTNSNSNNEHLSWRKKSDVSGNSKDDSTCKNTNSKIVSAFNPSSNKFGRRERFNSDPHDKNNIKLSSQYDSNPNTTSTSEIMIDSNSVKYSLVRKIYILISF